MSEFKPVAKKTIGYVPIQKVPFLLCLDDLAVLLTKESSTSRVDFKGINLFIYLFICVASLRCCSSNSCCAVMLFFLIMWLKVRSLLNLF